MQKEKRFVFDDPRPSSIPGTTELSSREWLDALDRSREIALSQQAGHRSSAEDALQGFADPGESSSRQSPEEGQPTGRGTLVKSQPSDAECAKGSQQSSRATLVKPQPSDAESVKGRKRFSRRHSKNGLSAVF